MNSQITFKINEKREYDAKWFDSADQALSELGGCSDSGDQLGLGVWQYEIDVDVKNQESEERTFTVVFQPEERTNGMKAYSGYDVVTCGEVDNDQSSALYEFCDWNQELIDALYAEAKAAAKAEYERLMADHEEMVAAQKMYMHEISGDVASIEDWKNDFDNMDVESWYGLPAEECEGLDWIKGGKLIEVKKDEDGEWVKV